MSSIVNSKFKTMDCVVLTKDVKLLCLISPSSITRNVKTDAYNYGHDNNPTNYEEYLKQATLKSYDLDIKSKLIFNLKLNGYIAVATMDSVLVNQNNVINTLKTNNIPNYENSALFRSSCYNNNIDYSYTNDIVSSYKSRVFGTPEIVLLPKDYHHPEMCTMKYYQSMKTFIDNVKNRRDKIDSTYRFLCYNRKYYYYKYIVTLKICGY